VTREFATSKHLVMLHLVLAIAKDLPKAYHWANVPKAQKETFWILFIKKLKES
jgi:hypothetical protein